MADTPVVFIQGARQTGKSTLVKSLEWDEKQTHYRTLDDVTTLSAARSDPQGFLAGIEGRVVLDEVQKAPGVFPAIKLDVDRHRRPGRFLLTGSAQVLLVPGLSESLAGRIEILTLWPFSQGELEGRKESFVESLFKQTPPAKPDEPLPLKDLTARLLTGGYPDICISRAQERRDAWYEAYVTTILQRDVRDLADIEGLTELPDLLRLLASRAGSLLNYADISREMAMPQTTLKRYMALLETTFLIQMLPSWTRNRGRRLVKSPKLYLNDTGLLSHLIGLNQRGLAGEPKWFGHLLENFVFMELCKQISWSTRKPTLHHFRTQTDREVDFVLEDRAGRIVGIEVKSGMGLGTDDFKGLQSLAEIAGPRFHRGIVLNPGTEIVPFGQNLHAVPISALWWTPQA